MKMQLMHEHEWRTEHAEELKKFEGKWIAILEDKVIAVGNSYNEVWTTVKSEYPNKLPLVTYILKPEEAQMIAYALQF